MEKQKPAAQPPAQQFTVEREKEYPISGNDIIELVMSLEELPIRFTPTVEQIKRRLMNAMQKGEAVANSDQ